MNLTSYEENATYISLNKGELYIPDEIEARSIGINGDIAEVLEQLMKISKNSYSVRKYKAPLTQCCQ